MKEIKLPNGKIITLNTEQEDALENIKEFLNDHDATFFTLTGRGGTGKTTIINDALKNFRYRNIVGAAISNVAKKKLSDCLNNIRCYTVAQLLGMREKIDNITGELTFEYDKNLVDAPPIGDADIILIDECSMISYGVHNLIQEHKKDTAKVVYLGDNVQLPPIDKERRKDEDSPTFNIEGVKLTQRMRQVDGSPIVPLTDLVANNIEHINARLPYEQHPIPTEKRITDYDFGADSGVQFVTNPHFAIDCIVEDLKKPEARETPYFTRAISYRNNNKYGNAPFSIAEINNQVRKKLWGNDVPQFIVGDIVVADANYPIGLGVYPLVYNADCFIVDKAEKLELNVDFEGKSIKETVWNLTLKTDSGFKVRDILVLAEESYKTFDARLEVLRKRAIDTKKGLDWKNFYKMKDTYAKINYAYAINSHKAQGSTYRNVYVFEDDIYAVKVTTIKEKNQSLYVALSRASHKLMLISRVIKPRTEYVPYIDIDMEIDEDTI